MNKITALPEHFGLIIELDEETKDPIGHPYFIQNFIEIHPEIDLQNIPDNWAFFRRLPIPDNVMEQVPLNPLKTPDSTYVWNNGVVEDYWYLRDMNTEELEHAFGGIDANHKIQIQGCNNSYALLRAWAEYNIERLENSEEWVSWLNSIPSTIIPNPPELLYKQLAE